MAQYYNLEKTAEILGLTPAEVQRMRERNELRAYRDGSDWKFKAEEVDKKLAELKQASEAAAESEGTDEDAEDVLATELELGQSDSSPSGRVIGDLEGDATVAADSDLKLAESDVRLGGSDIDMDETVSDESEAAAKVEKEAKSEADATVPDLDDIELALEGDTTVEDSPVAADQQATIPAGDSSVDVSAPEEEDDLVLGGSSGSGSDITIGGDSGISLVDPADSGLSLEEPVDLVGEGDESLELGEDDMLTFSEEADSESPTELGADDDFLLTPLEDTGEEDSESGSQVIALDTEEEAGEAATMAAEAAGPSMAAMLDEDFAPDEGGDLGVAAMEPAPSVAAPAAAPQQLAEGAPIGEYAAALPEPPYSIWNVVSLAGCVILLMLTGMMLFDLLRNMWSWSGPYDITSSLMDMILGWFGG